MGLFQGPLWTAIRNQGLAYSCTMQTDLSENEVVLLLQDCADVIKALASIKQILVSSPSLGCYLLETENNFV